MNEKRECVYCEQIKIVKQRYDYAGNVSGVMCDDCWKTSGLNSEEINEQETHQTK